MRSYLTRVGFLTAAGALLIALPMCAKDDGPSASPSASPTLAGSGEAAARAALKDTPLGTVASRDARGLARFILGAAPRAPVTLDVDAETAARIHLSRHAALFGLHEAAVRDASVTATQPLAGGARVVQFAQIVDGLEVFHARATVVVDAAKNLVSASSTLHAAGGAAHAVKAMSFSVAPEAALANVYAVHFGVSLPGGGAVRDLGSQSGGDLRSYAVPTAKNAPRILQATSKRILYPEGKKLTPAYYVEFLARAPRSRENAAFGYAVAANDGRVLYKTSLTASETFKYRVWAETDQNNIPMDGPYVDYSPHPTGKPDKVQPVYRAPNEIDMEGFNKNPQGAADPWLLPDKTTTFGNNVHAYSDRNDTGTTDDAGNDPGDGYDDGDIEADVTGPRAFLRTYDTAKKPNESKDQIKAAVTQIFYDTNWLHDYWYDSAFDEASGNAQLVNFGRGGKEGDPLRAEAQDGADFGQSNNANMTTFSEGTSPRMQMFVWSGAPNRKVTTTPALTFADGYGAAAFGPQTFDLKGDVVAATPADACDAPPTNVSGKIAVIDRGTCDFTVKGENAQAGGAIGILLVNNAAGNAPPSPGLPDDAVTIPLIGLSQEDGAKLKATLAAGAVSAQITRGAEVLHDGTIDNTVVAHEWGHYLHHRLVICGSQSCGGMSEGWADFNALLMSVREGDTLEGPAFPLAQYAAAGLLDNAPYFGIRRAPYSTDFAKNPFTFKHISADAELPTTAPLAPASADMSEVHNVGEIWAQALFEGYVNLHKVGQVASPKRSFQETKRRMADYIVAGMKITPIEPTFLEQRDAILSAVLAAARTDPTRKDDFNALATGFAKRGFGAGAVAPPTSSGYLTEVKESTSTGGEPGFISATLDDSGTSCDHDGVLDTGENGVLKVTVRNTGFAPLAGVGTKVSVTTTDPSVTFGPEATIDSIDVFGDAVATIPVTAAVGPIARGQVPLSITLKNDDAYTKDATTTVGVAYNYDDVEKSSTTDDAESAKEAWTAADDTPKLAAWSRQAEVSDHVWSANHVWHADDLGATSDESLVSPDLIVGTGDLTLSFEHRFAFETGAVVTDGPDVYFDGGVLEVTTDGGTTWDDVSKYVDPAYPQTIFDVEKNGNTLHGRKAWGGESDGYPQYAPVSLNFGTKLAGKTIKIRFRVGTDESGGNVGWDIDNVTLNGITNLPFPSRVDNRGICSVADGGAGSDSGAGSDAGSGTDSGSQGGGDAGLPGADAGPQGVPARYTNSDDTCAVSPAIGLGAHGARGAVGAGMTFFAGLMMVLRRRRRPAQSR